MRVCASGLRGACLVLGPILALGTSFGWGADVIRIEEVWELKVAQPDLNTNGPQVTTVLSPQANVAGLHATFNLNHISLPVYAPGGLQLQLWNGSGPVTEKRFPVATTMATSGETVTWTQSMEVASGMLTFEIIQGNSTTWGSFGDQGTLKIQTATSVPNLNGYSPSVSVANSSIGYASNRVQSLILLRVRVITTTGEQIEDSTARVVHQLEVTP